MLVVAIIVLIAIVITTLVIILCNYFESPFRYPYKFITIDISRKRNVVYEEYIDKYILENGIGPFLLHIKDVKRWEKDCLSLIENSVFKKKRHSQFLDCLDENHVFIFEFRRMQTRYRQRNYVKTPYKVFQLYHRIAMSMNDVKKAHDRLCPKQSNNQIKKGGFIRSNGWFWYYSENMKQLNPQKCGKWMIFFSDQEFAKKICSKAILKNVCYECKCLDLEKTNKRSGVICFYQNGDDIENHKRIITFMLDNNLVKKTKTGWYHNNSFKYDSQTRNGEYGDSFKGKLTLSDFIDLNSGEWIYKNDK